MIEWPLEWADLTCPRCGSEPGLDCVSIFGRTFDEPHNERLALVDPIGPPADAGTQPRNPAQPQRGMAMPRRPPEGCTCGSLRDLLMAAERGDPLPPCDVHRPVSRDPDAGIALNDDAALTAQIRAALGAPANTSNDL